jgi:hypothetical protein
LGQIDESVISMTLDRNNEAFRLKLLCSCNYLRALYSLPPIASLAEVLPALKEIYEEHCYQGWKNVYRATKFGDLSELEQIKHLAFLVLDSLGDPERQHDPNFTIYPYNFLQELIGKPRVSSIEKIDKTKLEWYVLTIPMLEQGVTLPSAGHQQLVEAEAKRLKIDKPLVVLGHVQQEGGHTGIAHAKNYISLSNSLDLDTRLYILYHEFGHVQYNDLVNDAAIERGEETISSMLAQPDFVLSSETVNHHLALGWKVLPSLQATEIGNNLYKLLYHDTPGVKKLLIENHGLWVPPTDAKEREETDYNLGQERRADLYMLRHLYEQGHLNATLTFIRNYAMVDVSYRPMPLVIAQGKVAHPSAMERALYALGFLVAQGIDVSKVLYAWETQGTCTPG